MNADEIEKADEIVRALRTECSDCSERNCCNHGNNPVKYCPVIDAADLIDSLTAQLASVTAERDTAVEDLRKNRARKCDCCAYAGRPERWPCVDCQSPISNYGDGWKWRGPQKGENDDG